MAETAAEGAGRGAEIEARHGGRGRVAHYSISLLQIGKGLFALRRWGDCAPGAELALRRKARCAPFASFPQLNKGAASGCHFGDCCRGPLTSGGSLTLPTAIAQGSVSHLPPRIRHRFGELSPEGLASGLLQSRLGRLLLHTKDLSQGRLEKLDEFYGPEPDRAPWSSTCFPCKPSTLSKGTLRLQQTR